MTRDAYKKLSNVLTQIFNLSHEEFQRKTLRDDDVDREMGKLCRGVSMSSVSRYGYAR